MSANACWIKNACVLYFTLVRYKFYIYAISCWITNACTLIMEPPWGLYFLWHFYTLFYTDIVAGEDKQAGDAGFGAGWDSNLGSSD